MPARSCHSRSHLISNSTLPTKRSQGTHFGDLCQRLASISLIRTFCRLVPILQAEISGFEKALTNLSEAEVQNATVKVTIEQTTSNTIAVPQAIFELPERSDEQGVAGAPTD